jgi:hypothetical protein
MVREDFVIAGRRDHRLAATGTARWRLRRRAQLSAGRYLVRAQVLDAAGRARRRLRAIVFRVRVHVAASRGRDG